ncbi:MAG: SDR family oxidoreductase [Rhodobiaceae bacterium]|nr:SDR family oxidoreductase [Rhodobiaceae bacterium]
MSDLFCFGLGFSALALARRLKAQGWTIAGTVRGEGAIAAAAAQGIEALAFDGAAPSAAVARRLAQATHLLISVPPGAGGDPVLACHRADIIAAPDLEWIGYLSTIGVYGDHDGAWIDEETPPRPQNERSQWRLEAETAWRDLARERGAPLAIFRLAGIYGPGRNQLRSLTQGKARTILKPGQVFNRIHVEDIAATVLASIARPPEGARAYNVCDDEPAPPQEVTAFAAALLGLAPPPLVAIDDPQLSAIARSFYTENKRCRNARIKDELGVILRFPTYREGLKRLFADREA